MSRRPHNQMKSRVNYRSMFNDVASVTKQDAGSAHNGCGRVPVHRVGILSPALPTVKEFTPSCQVMNNPYGYLKSCSTNLDAFEGNVVSCKRASDVSGRSQT